MVYTRGQMKDKWEVYIYRVYTEFAKMYVRLRGLFHRRFRSVVAITSASHAEGRQFEPGRKQLFLFVFVCFVFFSLLKLFVDCMTSSILKGI